MIGICDPRTRHSNGKHPLNPLEILAKSYRGEDDWDL